MNHYHENRINAFVLPYLYLAMMTFGPITTAQTPKKRLPTGINIPTTSQVYPSVTGDDMFMVFMSNYTNSGFFELMYSNKISSEHWERGEPLTNINKTDLDHLGSFTISYDGKYLFFSSQRAKGVGRFDIWYSERKGNNWSAPVNMGKPVNSTGNEGNPSISADGRSLYFMRCETMDRTTKKDCKLYVSKKQSPTRWGEPELLPSPINLRNETTPRILIDNKTLLFSSDRAGGKGAMDLYLTRFENETWSKPIPLNFINTGNNDEFVSVPARGDIIYYHDKSKENFQLFKAIIPPPLRPRNVRMITGTVHFAGGPQMDALVQAIDVSTNETAGSVRTGPEDGSFFMVLPEGSKYDFSVFPMQPGLDYYAEILDMDSIGKSSWEKPEYAIHQLKNGATFALNALLFDDSVASISPTSAIEMRRLSRFMKQNTGKKFEIGAFIDTVKIDSIHLPGLTEVLMDTLLVTMNKNILESDSTSEHSELERLNLYLDEGYTKFDEDTEQIILMKIKYRFHNDRTEKMAQSVFDYLIDRGAPVEMFTFAGYGDQWSQNLATIDKNYWIEIKVID